MKIVHIIPALERGGAEHVLCRLIENSPAEEYEHEVICLRNKGPLARRLEERGVKVQAVGLKSFIALPGAFLRLARMLRKAEPDLVQTWMYHADLFGGLAAKLSGSPPVIWSIRQSSFLPAGPGFFTRIVLRLSGWLSKQLPSIIITNSYTGKNFHINYGYESQKFEVIPNGIDCEKFKPDQQAYVSVREELDLDKNALLVGLVARFHPQKDHLTFIRSVGILSAKKPEVNFLLCGKSISSNNKNLQNSINNAGLTDNIYLLGERSDMPRIQAALDIAVCSSVSEGMPNAILEAMACAVPCVVTDVGDTAMLVDDRFVVSPENSKQLAKTINQVLNLPKNERNKIGNKNRQTIEENYSMEKMVGRFHELYNHQI